jgi:hypothetical protein
MIEKRLKNLSRISTLIATRQLYFLGRNWYLLMYQPYLTLKEIYKKRDKSQIFLLAVTALTPAIIYSVARIIWDLMKYQRLLFVTGKVFLAMVGIQILVLGYLGYWTLQVLIKEE